MRTLFIDIETAPNTAHTWSLWNVNVSLNQLVKSSYTLCFAYSWGDEDEVYWVSEETATTSLAQDAWDLINEADAIVTWNGDHFDIPILNKDFLLAGLPPASPVASIDLMKTVKKRFRMTSNKLEFVSKALGLEGKVSHEGFGLWTKYMDGDEEAREHMEIYNKQDVQLLKEMYPVLLPWINNHPHAGLYSGVDNVCPNCGGSELVKRGFSYTSLGKYQRYVCSCGKWCKSGTRIINQDMRSA